MVSAQDVYLQAHHDNENGCKAVNWKETYPPLEQQAQLFKTWAEFMTPHFPRNLQMGPES
jgi:hypothetical protein